MAVLGFLFISFLKCYLHRILDICDQLCLLASALSVSITPLTDTTSQLFIKVKRWTPSSVICSVIIKMNVPAVFAFS